MSTPSNPGYETIPEDEAERPLELAADESSHIGDINDDNNNNVMPSKKYVVSACILILLLTFIGGRQSITTFSSKSNIDIIGGTKSIYFLRSSFDGTSSMAPPHRWHLIRWHHIRWHLIRWRPSILNLQKINYEKY